MYVVLKSAAENVMLPSVRTRLNRGSLNVGRHKSSLTARHWSSNGLRSLSSIAGADTVDITTRQPDVVVIGAGCAGVACASALASENQNILLVEQDPKHLGGRARAWACPDTGHPMHIGPHIVYSDYPNYFKLIKMLDPEGKERIVWQRAKDVFTTINGTAHQKDGHDVGGKPKFHSWPIALVNSTSEGTFRVPPPLNWIPSVLKDPFIPSIRDSLSLVPFGAFCMQLQGNNEIINNVLKRSSSTVNENIKLASLAPVESSSSMPAAMTFRANALESKDLEVWQRLDQISGQDLLDAFGVSPAYQQHIMAFVANSILNVPLTEVSGASLVSWFRKLVGRPGVRLGFVDGGLGTVLEPVGAFLKEKQDGVNGLRMGTRVTAVRRRDVDGSKNSGSDLLEVEMVDSVSGQTFVIQPKHGVVITLPPLEALKILPEQDRAKPLERLLVNVGGQEKQHAVAYISSDNINVSPPDQLQETANVSSISAFDHAKKLVDTPENVLSRFKPCKYVSVYFWFDQDIRDPKATAHADSKDPIAFSGHQFWAKRYHPDDLCCEFYDYSKIYTRNGTTPAKVLDELGIPATNENSGRQARSMIGVNMIDVDRLDPPADSVQKKIAEDPVCSFPAPLSTPAARHLAASAWSDEQLVERAMVELKESVGDDLFNKDAKILKAAVHRIPMAIPRMVVGTEMRRPVAGELHENSGLFLAGDYCQTGFMNCMEGATQAGFECADEVLGRIRENVIARKTPSSAVQNSISDAPTVANAIPDTNAVENATDARLSRTSTVSITDKAQINGDRWALPHPGISRFAHLLSRHLVWPVSRWLWASQLQQVEKIIR